MFSTEAETSAMAWLRPEADACWTWDAACEVIAWQDGSTLLFREELAQIVERLLPGKVPPAGILFLLLAAAKGKIPASTDPESQLPLARLATLAKLPQDLLSGIAAKTHLIEYFTEGVPCVPPEQGATVLHVLREGLPLLHLLSDSSKGPLLAFHLHQLEPALLGMEIDALRHRLETGMDSAPLSADLESTAAQVAQLLNELKQDSEFAGLVQLVKDLMAALTLPHAMASPDVTALGGLSDISNRGPLHRLLTSELAQDHDVLAMRLALNEALYLKNEPPAVAPLSELVILIDSGIRLWGTPRVFATAAALALLAKTPKRQVARTFRAQLAGAAVAELTRKPGLTRHLAALELNEHPGASLQHLFDQMDGSHPIDLAVITHERALDDSAFHLPHGLPDYAHIYLIGVNREGDITMSLATPQGRRPLKQARLDLHRLLPGHAPSVLDPKARYPAIFSQEPFPFLLVPPDLIADLSFKTKDYCAGLNNTGTVWYWDSIKKGARQLKAPPIPGTPKVFAHDETVRCLVLLTFLSGDTFNELHLLIMNDDPTREEKLKVRVIGDVPCKPRITFRRNGLLYVVYHETADVIDLATGTTLARTSVDSSLAMIGDGFFRRHPQQIGSLGWNGQELVWEPLSMKPPQAGAVVHRVFHREGMEGPWYIDYNGAVQQTCTPYTHFQVQLAKNVIPEISPNGHEIWAALPNGTGTIITLPRPNSPAARKSSHRPPWTQRTPAPHWSIRTNFTHIACDASGHLVLRSGKGRWVRIELNATGTAFLFNAVPDPGREETTRVTFSIILPPPDTDYTLAEAVWPGSGSRALRDSRGMLHLQSGNAQLPEVTIVLAESNSLPVWTSNGLMIGPAFFVGENGSSEHAIAIDGIIRSFIEGLR